MKFKFEELKLPLLPSEDISERAKMFIAISLVKQILLSNLERERGCPVPNWEDFKSTLKKGIFEYLGDTNVNRSALNITLDRYIEELRIYIDRLSTPFSSDTITERWGEMTFNEVGVTDLGTVVVCDHAIESCGDGPILLVGTNRSFRKPTFRER